MSFQASFQQILSAKMQKNSSVAREEAPSSTSSMTTDPVHLAFLMGKVDRFSFTPGRAKNYPRPQPRPRPPHIMTSSQQISFEFLKRFDEALTENFSSRDLKAAFRQAALKTHPDQGGNVMEFIELKAHYKNLSSLVIQNS